MSLEMSEVSREPGNLSVLVKRAVRMVREVPQSHGHRGVRVEGISGESVELIGKIGFKFKKLRVVREGDEGQVLVIKKYLELAGEERRGILRSHILKMEYRYEPTGETSGVEIELLTGNRHKAHEKKRAKKRDEWMAEVRENLGGEGKTAKAKETLEQAIKIMERIDVL